MFTTDMPGPDVIDRQADIPLPAILAGIIIATKNLAPCQFHVGTGPVDLVLQPDDRRPRKQLGNCMDMAAAIDNHASLTRQDQSDGPAGGAYVDRFKVCV
jgi:hypothetical protein